MTPGVFETNHFIPYIFMEWKVITIEKDSLCPNIKGLRKLLESKGYTARHANSLGKLLETCFQGDRYAADIVWVHEKAIPLWKQEDENKVINCLEEGTVEIGHIELIEHIEVIKDIVNL